MIKKKHKKYTETIGTHNVWLWYQLSRRSAEAQGRALMFAFRIAITSSSRSLYFSTIVAYALTVTHSTSQTLRLTRWFGTVLGSYQLRANKSNLCHVYCRAVALSAAHASKVTAITIGFLYTANPPGTMCVCSAAGDRNGHRRDRR